MAAAQRWRLGRTPIHVIDREADSVSRYLRRQPADHRFVIRADCQRVVLHEGREGKLGEVAAGLAGSSRDVRDAAGRPEVVTIRAGAGTVRVAEIPGCSVSDFVVAAAQEAAHRTIEETHLSSYREASSLTASP